MFRVFRCCLLLLSLVAVLPAATPPGDQLRGGKVEWARLKTSNPYWNRHSERDVHVLTVMRSNTSLNIGDTWHSASAGDLGELCAYPFIFAESIASLSNAEGTNVAEYLRRGGFLLIDACVAVSINPDAGAFLAAQTKVLARQFPQLRVAPLGPEHEVFSIYFKMTKFPPQTRSGSNPRWANGSTEPLHGMFVGDRMVAVVSLSGFQCGLVQNSKPTDVVQMVTNIYLYAMTR